MKELTGVFTSVVTLREPTWLHDFTAPRVDVRPAAKGSLLERGRANGKGIRKATIGVFAVDVVLRDLDVTNEHAFIGVQLGWQNDRADRVLIEDCRIHAVGRLPATNHDHGIYAEQVSKAVIRRTVISDCADRGVQFYPNADDCIVEHSLITACGSGVIFSGGNEGLGKQHSERNVVRESVIANSKIRYLVEAHDSRADAGNVVERCVLVGSARGRAVQPGIVGVTVRDCIGA